MRKAQAVAPRSFSASVVREVPVRFPPCLSAVTKNIYFPLEDHCFVLETGSICAGIGHMHFWRKHGLLGSS